MAYTTIDDGSAHIQTVLYTGDGNSTQAITNDGNSDLQPDFVWTKQRSHAVGHNLTDSSRGVSKALFSEDTSVEDTGGNISSLNSDGFTTTNANRTNQSGRTFVGWQWKANGGTRTTFTDSGANPGTVSHGLGAVPKVLIVKNRDATTDWAVYHRNASSAGNDSYLELNTGDAVATAGTVWNDTSPSSSVFTVGTNTKTNTDGEKYIAYCFAEIQGYSKFGIYQGNSNANGAFIYTGFKPSWLMIKNIDATQSWWIFDNKRQGYNGGDVRLRADRDTAESTGSKVDFLSNGFKWRDGDNAWNYSGNDFVYLAFAEHPVVSSKGVPVTAR
jgi:hypothetical protein